MKLADLLETETGVDRNNLMFLRHSSERTTKLLEAGGTIEEYTAIQEIKGQYDFLHESKPPAHVLVVVVHDRVHGVYRVQGVREEGFFEVLATPAYRRFSQLYGKENVLSRLFNLDELHSGAVGATVTGWTAPVISVLRGSHRGMFDQIEVDSVPFIGTTVDSGPGGSSPALLFAETTRVQVTAQGMNVLRKLIPHGQFGIAFRSSAEKRGSIYVTRHGDWLMTIYAGEVHKAHSEVEIAMAVPRIAYFPEKRTAGEIFV